MNFLSELVDDGEQFDIATLSYNDEQSNLEADDINLDSDNIAILNPSNSFELLLNKLLNTLAVDIVRSLQHFVSRVTTCIWNSRKDVALLNSVPTASFANNSSIKPLQPSSEYNLHDLNYKTRGLIGQSSSTNPLILNNEDLHISELASVLWVFLDELFVKMRESPLWSVETGEQFEQTKSDCEKFVFLKLHEPLFQIATAGLDDHVCTPYFLY